MATKTKRPKPPTRQPIKTASDVVQHDPRLLKNAPINIRVYGEDVPESLEASIAAHGIMDPLVVCRSSDPSLDKLVISGRRRRMVAVKLGMKTVPCREWHSDDARQADLNVLLFNVRAEITPEQRIRMGKEIETIERQIAEERMKSGKKVERNGEVRKGAAVELAAKAVGLSASTLARGEKVVEKIDELESDGQVEEAQVLRDELNNGSIAKASRIATGTEPEVAKPKGNVPNPETQAISKQVARLVAVGQNLQATINDLMTAISNKHKASPAFGQRFKKFEMMMTLLAECAEKPMAEIRGIAQKWADTVPQLKE